MTFAYGNQQQPSFGFVVIEDERFGSIPFYELQARMVVSNFNELFIGDLAFLAMLVGMNNSAGQHCLLCMHRAKDFNCPHTSLVPRTKAKLEECLAEYMTLSATQRKPPPNYRGVNGAGLWDIDPQRVIVPILHCPMGLVDKVLESIKLWINIDVEDLKDDDNNTIRSNYKDAVDRHKATKMADEHAQALLEAHPTSPEAKQMASLTSKARKEAKKEEAAQKILYTEMIQTHNAKKTSLTQLFENVYRKNGITREHYHGGKFNGVNCIRIMEKASSLLLGDGNSPGLLQLCIESKVATIEVGVIESHMKDYCRLLGLLDGIWSSVRGIDAGLLPTPQQLGSLKLMLREGKAMWLQTKITTNQPKWHLTFDGHLYYQVARFGGLADKSDETIEKGHQTLKALRERFRRISSYERRETCIRRELRRGRSHEVLKHIEAYEEAIKQNVGTKRASDAADRISNKKQAKEEKRTAFAVNAMDPTDNTS
jgi:hypothetical protein